MPEDISSLSKKRKISGSRRILKWSGISLIIIWAITVVQVLSLKFIDPPFTIPMAWKWLWNEDNIRHNPPRHIWKPLHRISPHLRKAVLAAEDQRFLSHHGFDFIEMNKAIKNIALKRGFRGASTITMQAARTVFLWPGRSCPRKVAEAYYTVLMEMFWSKRRILEMYLNMVDWGTGLIGAEAASRTYFKQSCSSLSPSQAALLTAVLPNPHKWSPRNPNPRVLRRQRRILRDMEHMPRL